MNTPVIVLEQRLRSRALALVPLLVLALFFVVSLTLIATSKSPSLPTSIYVLESIVPLILVACFFLFQRIVVRVVETSNGRTLEVLYGPRGYVRQVFGPDQLVAAHARNYSFVQMGGWGYRGSLRLIRRAALATRRGDALDVELRGKRRFIVTVDDPDTFVAALGLASAK